MADVKIWRMEQNELRFYKVLSAAAEATVVIFHDVDWVEVIARTSTGNYGHCWLDLKTHPLRALVNFNGRLAVEQLCEGPYYMYDPDAVEDYVEAAITAACQHGRLPRERYKAAREELLSIALAHASSREVLHHELAASAYFAQVFEKPDGLPDPRRPDPRHLCFLRQIWRPLMTHLAAEIDEQNDQELTK